jgi:hypothetical protein
MSLARHAQVPYLIDKIRVHVKSPPRGQKLRPFLVPEARISGNASRRMMGSLSMAVVTLSGTKPRPQQYLCIALLINLCLHSFFPL